MSLILTFGSEVANGDKWPRGNHDGPLLLRQVLGVCENCLTLCYVNSMLGTFHKHRICQGIAKILIQVSNSILEDHQYVCHSQWYGPMVLFNRDFSSQSATVCLYFGDQISFYEVVRVPL